MAYFFTLLHLHCLWKILHGISFRPWDVACCISLTYCWTGTQPVPCPLSFLGPHNHNFSSIRLISKPTRGLLRQKLRQFLAREAQQSNYSNTTIRKKLIFFWVGCWIFTPKTYRQTSDQKIFPQQHQFFTPDDGWLMMRMAPEYNTDYAHDHHNGSYESTTTTVVSTSQMMDTMMVPWSIRWWYDDPYDDGKMIHTVRWLIRWWYDDGTMIDTMMIRWWYHDHDPYHDQYHDGTMIMIDTMIHTMMVQWSIWWWYNDG